jgi:hypothetical protein
MFAAPAAGVALGALAWTLLGGASDARVSGVQDRLSGLSFRPPEAGAAPAALLSAAAAPLFVLTTGPNAAQDVKVQLQGLARSPARMAALVSINGAPAQWIAQGQSQGGVTVQEVGAGGVVLLTPLGRKEASLADPPAGSGAPGGSGAAPRPPAAP